jgi:hypothetical protein
MKILELNSLPTSIDVTLYRYNYIDNKLWVQIKNQLDYIEVNKTSVLVSKDQLNLILLQNYKDDLNAINSTGSKFFHNRVNTIYFIWMLLKEMKNLNYLKISLNTDKSYTRLSTDGDGAKTIDFDFKILTATLRLSDIFKYDEINIINSALYKLNILQQNEPYINIGALKLIDIVDTYLVELEQNNEDHTESFSIISEFLELFTYKIEKDNPLILLITDY